MTTINYYIEDLATGLVVMNVGEMKSYLPGVDAKMFASYEAALAGIDLLPANEYRIFSRIVKS